MDRALYVGMAAAKQTMLAQAVQAHNLANVNTTGFREDLAEFQSVLVSGPGYPTRIYSQVQAKGMSLKEGGQISTGQELDIAINGEGWIAVQAPDGGEAYTRAGNLRVSVGGVIETGAGYPVLGSGGPIAVPPFEKLEIGADGTVSIRPVGQAASALVVVDRIKLVNPPPSELFKGSDGLVRTRAGQPAIPDAQVTVASGVLESSNVNAVEAMVRMINLARQFELQVKVMRTVEENDTASVELMRLS